MPWNRRRGLVLLLCLLSICAVRSDTGDSQPSDHGLANDKDPFDPSPAMAAFFSGRPAAPRPEAQNTTDPVWGVAGKVSPAVPESDNHRRRMTLLAAGVVCGFVGVGLLVAAAGYTVRTRRVRSGQQTGLQTGHGPGSSGGPSPNRWKSCREIRLGIV